MELKWVNEKPAYWDAPKQKIIGGAPEGIFRTANVKESEVLPGEWWRVEADGETVGYGWMETTWGDAEILLAVDDSKQKHGIGTFIINSLEREAQERGLNYLYNEVRDTHPDKEGITRWLASRNFKGGVGEDRALLKRAIPQSTT